MPTPEPSPDNDEEKRRARITNTKNLASSFRWKIRDYGQTAGGLHIVDFLGGSAGGAPIAIRVIYRPSTATGVWLLHRAFLDCFRPQNRSIIRSNKRLTELLARWAPIRATRAGTTSAKTRRAHES